METRSIDGLALYFDPGEQKAADLIVAWDDKLQQLAEAMPQLGVADYVEKVNADFDEESADHSQDMWEDALKGLFD